MKCNFFEANQTSHILYNIVKDYFKRFTLYKFISISVKYCEILYYAENNIHWTFPDIVQYNIGHLSQYRALCCNASVCRRSALCTGLWIELRELQAFYSLRLHSDLPKNYSSYWLGVRTSSPRGTRLRSESRSETCRAGGSLSHTSSSPTRVTQTSTAGLGGAAQQCCRPGCTVTGGICHW